MPSSSPVLATNAGTGDVGNPVVESI